MPQNHVLILVEGAYWQVQQVLHRMANAWGNHFEPEHHQYDYDPKSCYKNPWQRVWDKVMQDFPHQVSKDFLAEKEQDRKRRRDEKVEKDKKAAKH